MRGAGLKGKRMSKILLTGGGTAGHATPNLALAPFLEKEGHELLYVGTKDGIEKELVEAAGIRYLPISAGKLRRYLSLKNFTDIFRILKGFSEAKAIMKQERPELVFSKGGFVTVPVVFAAAGKKIPVVLHESDYTPGLANKLCIPKAEKVCVSFEATKSCIKGDKCVVTGLPVRAELLSGSREKGLELLGFDGKKPVLLIIGGSLGAQRINEAVDEAIDSLLKSFDIVHVRGKGKLNPDMDGKTGYRSFEYVSAELKDFFAAADAVVSRAGANVIFELLALKKPMLLIPLDGDSTRGDQVLNAEYFEKHGYARVLKQKEMTAQTLTRELELVMSGAGEMKKSMEAGGMSDGAANVLKVIYSVLEKHNG